MNHTEARAIVEQAWQAVHGHLPTDNEATILQAVGWLESQYGRAAGQHAKWAAEGKFNWGNLETVPKDGSCPTGSEKGKDNTNVRCFYVFKSDLDAAKAYIRNITANGTNPKPEWTEQQKARGRLFAQRTANVMNALANGTVEDFARALVSVPGTGYYEAPVGQYAAGLRAAVNAITGTPQNVVWHPDPPHPAPPIPNAPASSSSFGWTFATLAAVGGLAWWVTRGRRR